MNIQEAKEQYDNAKSDYIKTFWTELKAIFDEYPKFEGATFRLNNNEWNDGSATTFYISFEDGINYTYNGVAYDDFCFCRLKNEPENINEKPAYFLCRVFSLSQDIHEEMFSDEYESMCITKEMTENRIKEILEKTR